jgi:uncharacterized protein YbjT (DUF2867 family)
MSNLETVSIVTGNSNSGQSCIAELFAKYPTKFKVRGVFRTQQKAQPFQEKYPNLEVVIGVDASQPDSLKKAFVQAKSAVIVTVHDPSRGFQDDALLTENLINAAVKEGVKYIILVASFTVNNCQRMSGIASRFKPLEDRLEVLGKQADLKWTVLRGGCFMENVLHVFEKLKNGESSFSYPNIVCPMVDTHDIGRSAAACLAADSIERHHEKRYEMNGPEMISSSELARRFSKVLNREIKYLETPKQVYHRYLPPAVAELDGFFKFYLFAQSVLSFLF